MGFTTPCFIRKNTLDIREKLEELGYYKNSPKWTDDCSIIWAYQYPVKGFDTPNYVIANAFDIPFDKYSALRGKFIDCGTNEELFLAIAALRDDTDKNQWFVLDHDNIWEAVGCYQYKGDFILCNHDRWYCGTDVAQAHKATVKELQELFSQKIQVPQIEWNINDVINKD